MASLNKVFLLGRLGRDPELRHTASGKAVVSFSIATDERRPDGNGGWAEFPEWHNCVAWDKTAEAVAKFLGKGSPCFIEGRLQTREYEKDGVKRKATEIVVFNVQFLAFKRDEGAGDARPASTTAARSSDPLDDDIPF